MAIVPDVCDAVTPVVPVGGPDGDPAAGGDRAGGGAAKPAGSEHEDAQVRRDGSFSHGSSFVLSSESASRIAGRRSANPNASDTQWGTKERIRQILDEMHASDETAGGEWKVTRTRFFTAAVMSAICLNSVYLGIETDHADTDEHHGAWYAIDVVFISVFSLEIVLRLYDEKLLFFKDAWNYLDVSLAVVSIIDTFVLSSLSQDGSGAAELDMVSVMRVLRVLRIARVFRLLRFCRKLWLLLIGVVEAMRALFWAWVLLAVIIYIFAILTTRTLGKVYSSKNAEIDEYFGTVPKSMFTLFQVMTLEAWPSVVRNAMKVEPWVLALFLVFMIATTYSIMNVIVAVIVESTLEQASSEKQDLLKHAEEERKKSGSKIHEVFSKTDTDGNGQVTKEEFLNAIQRKDVSDYLEDVGVDVRQAENLFDILDFDDSGSLDCEEFINGVLNTRGQAKAKDILAVQCSVWRTEQKMRSEVVRLCQQVDARMAKVDDDIDDLQTLVQALGTGLENMSTTTKACPPSSSLEHMPTVPM